MKPLSIDTLKFHATLSVRKDGEHEYRIMKLRYYIEYAGHQADLIRINLEDTRPSVAGDPLHFWFYYQQMLVPWPNDEPAAKNTAPDSAMPESDFLIRHFPSIDLIVFSSVRVFVQRMTETANEFQSIGFLEVADIKTRLRDAELSPVRPKISLRRVHREAQVPLLGSAFRLQDLQQPFSFYADRNGDPHYTLQSNLAALLQAHPGMGDDDRRRGSESWTHVEFDDIGTEFTFTESTYRLRVFDQHYDAIDGDPVPTEDLDFEEARAREHKASQLISEPKYFDYTLSFNSTPRLMSGGYQAKGNPSVLVKKSDNVHLAGTLLRDTQTDARTTALIKAANPRAAQMRRGTNYRDHLPAVRVRNEAGDLPGGGVEESWPAPANYTFTKSPGRQFFEFQVSLVIGVTPIAGEAFGLYELYTALNHNEDAFGNKLTDKEKILVAIAAILPFVSFSNLKRGVRHLSRDVFPMLADTVEKGKTAISTLQSV